MSYIKIRGHKRRQHNIEQWRSGNLKINFQWLERNEYDYTKLIIHPWCDKSITKSQIPQPSGKTKQLMLAGLLNIYDAWKIQLEQLGKPYYLKIWLFEPRFSKSQVVCAIGEKIKYYDGLFHRPEAQMRLQTTNYGHLKNRLNELSWEHGWDEEHLEEEDYTNPEYYDSISTFEENKRWLHKILRKPHRVTVFDEDRKFYEIKKGDIWIGG